MRLRKFEASTEQEAMELVKEELGLDALILNIKKIQPRGLKALFRKTIVEITAAYTDKAPQFSREGLRKEYEQERVHHFEAVAAALEKREEKGEVQREQPVAVVKEQPTETDEALAQAEKIMELQSKLQYVQQRLDLALREVAKTKNSSKKQKYPHPMVQMMFDALRAQGVTEKVADFIFEELKEVQETEKIDINFIVKIVYNKIIHMIGEPQTISVADLKAKTPKVIAFIGPTGVGKTTTIAKLSSNFILNNRLKIGLIAADTYRIAAVEQLRTYAEILNIDMNVIYNETDLIDNLVVMGKTNDMIMIDTAGRSHKNRSAVKELKDLLDCMEDCEKYLVLSLTTKYEDLLNIIEHYAKMTDFKILFTKLDEATNLGAIVNICYTTGKRISYVTTGQNVPEDIEVIHPEKIAKALLGFGGDIDGSGQ